MFLNGASPWCGDMGFAGTRILFCKRPSMGCLFPKTNGVLEEWLVFISCVVAHEKCVFLKHLMKHGP